MKKFIFNVLFDCLVAVVFPKPVEEILLQEFSNWESLKYM